MKTILVAGDICLDVVGIPIPAPSANDQPVDNWQLTGETRTHFLLGGALLLADWVRAANPAEINVLVPRPCKPAALMGGDTREEPLELEQLLAIASRLTRDEIVHSLLNLGYFRATPQAKNEDTIRIRQKHGYSGPKEGDPSLKLLPPESKDDSPTFVVLDDTGNRFRRSSEQWPAAIHDNHGNPDTVAIYKLHRPLPTPEGAAGTEPRDDAASHTNQLWESVAKQFGQRRLVIVSVDDLRDAGIPISRGLSWERTALDLVWQLGNDANLAVLRDCPHLVIRLGLDGAVYWHHCPGDVPYQAWLIYDPLAIEGATESTHDGQMVGYGSAFTAALVRHLAAAATSDCLAPIRDDQGIHLAKPIELGIRAGLVAARRLLRIGYGPRENGEPNYPTSALFDNFSDDDTFACNKIPLIPRTTTPDRGYWRLLDSIFENKRPLLHRAVALTATGAKAIDPLDEQAKDLLRQVPMAVFAGALRTYDRREIENYRALYALMLDYIHQPNPKRPLSVAVFGPPGAGKSFGVTQVAKALGQLGGARPIKTRTFNLSQYQTYDQLAEAFHLVRDLVLQGNIPLVFFDEFDTAMNGVPLGWLRYFLAPMQDAEFLDRGTPHPIGKAIFVFAGGTCGSFAEFAAPLQRKQSRLERSQEKHEAFVSAKGPDFLSRLRGTLDVPGLELQAHFDPFGPVEAFPCEAAILLRRAGILAHQLNEKAPGLCDSARALRVSPTVLRALLHLPHFEHGNRSLEALLDMSQLSDAARFTPSLLPSASQVGLHANSEHLSQLLATDYPFAPEDREILARSIHERYVEQQRPHVAPDDPSLRSWDSLSEKLRNSNREQADDIAVKLRAANLWFRKVLPGTTANPSSHPQLTAVIETLARHEHDRWVAEKRRQGWSAARDMERDSRDNELRLHNCLFPWEELTENLKELDRATARSIPETLASAGYEVFRP